MKSRHLLSLLILALALPPAAKVAGAERGGSRTSFHAILIVASNQKGETDRRLAAYEPNLHRILRFESYRFINEASGSVPVPGKGSLSLGRGYRLELETEAAGNEFRRVRARWLDGDRVAMTIGLSLRPGVPAILVGPPWGDNGDICAMILVAR